MMLTALDLTAAIFFPFSFALLMSSTVGHLFPLSDVYHNLIESLYPRRPRRLGFAQSQNMGGWMGIPSYSDTYIVLFGILDEDWDAGYPISIRCRAKPLYDISSWTMNAFLIQGRALLFFLLPWSLASLVGRFVIIIALRCPDTILGTGQRRSTHLTAH